MEISLEAWLLPEAITMWLVSILVLMEISLEDFGEANRNRRGGVSILVLMEISLEVCIVNFPFYFKGVSILVLMEISLEVLKCFLQGLKRLCFNPCFDGDQSGSRVVIYVI